MSSIEFMPLGGGQEIGANSYLVRFNGRDILLDCGVHPKKEGFEALPDFSLLDRRPEAVIISHAHVDHCGALPQLIKRFRSTMPYATKATLRIMDRMLHNSVAVMESLSQERGIDEYPLYSHEDVEDAVRRTYGLNYDKTFILRPAEPLAASFHHAGHVLGGASVLIKTPEHNLFYTGDICAADQELVAGRVPLDESLKVDTLVIESTYGADPDADSTNYEYEVERFADAVNVVLDRGGVVLVPSFALGRTQELLNIIARLQESGRIEQVPVLASGLGRAIYEVYETFPDYLRADAQLRPIQRFGRVGNVWNKETLRELIRKPSIIVATSGMMIENTPSALIAQELVQHTQHGIFFVGYLDPDTLGYKLRNATVGTELQFQLEKRPVEVRLEDIQWFYFSAHAPRQALHEVIEHTKPRNIVFVHGDPDAVAWMHENAGDGYRKFAPAIGEKVTLGS